MCYVILHRFFIMILPCCVTCIVSTNSTIILLSLVNALLTLFSYFKQNNSTKLNTGYKGTARYSHKFLAVAI